MSVFDLSKASVQTFNGHNINDGTNYASKLIIGQGPMLDSQVVLTERSDAMPINSGKRFSKGKVWQLQVSYAIGGTGSTQQLLSWFDITDKTEYKLVVKTTADNSLWYVNCTPETMPRIDGKQNALWVNLVAADPVWRINTPVTDTWNITASGQTKNLTVGGNKFAKPILTITPTSAKGADYSYKAYVLVYNRQPVASKSEYMDITGQTGKAWNTSAIIASASISNQVNHVGGYSNSDLTWAIDTAAGGGLAATGGICYVDTEQILYTSVTGGNTLNITAGGRGWGGTTAASHADNAVIKQSKILANGNDIQPMVDGAPVNYWLTGINTTTTGVHIALNLSAGISLTLKTAIAGSGAVTQIAVNKTAANLIALKSLAVVPNKFVVIVSAGGKEIFSYTGVDLTNYLITGTVRQQKDATTFPNVAHAALDLIYWVEHDIWNMYGNSQFGTPDIDQTQKPLQDLSTSTNASWAWTTTFWDYTSVRPGAWAPAILSTLNRVDQNNTSYIYTADQNTWANPTSEMGMRISAFINANKWRAETATIDWRFSNPFGFTTITVSGKKYGLNATNSFPAVCNAYKSMNGVTLFSIFNEAAPAANTWTAFGSHSGVALTATYPIIVFRFSGSIGASASNMAAAQFDTVTLARDTAKTPIIIYGTESSNYYLGMGLTNTTTGGWIAFYYPVALNNAVVIDCNARTISYYDGTVIPSVQPIFYKSGSTDWFNLSPGVTNSLTFTDAGTGNVTIGFSWEDRSL